MDDIGKTIIGKDVIESLTLGMYEDSRFIYREYIQNSADQIDKAASLGVLSSRDEGYIEIEISPTQRKICFEDNATGIKADEAIQILRNIAQSTKQRGVDKGFRGIGRLGGLGYCDKLTFETSYKGEDIKTIMVWDAKQLKQIINNRVQKEEATEVIDTITSADFTPEAKDKHYFKVILEGVTNDLLLDKQLIREYLSMVAPVPLHPRFLLLPKLRNYLEANDLTIDEYDISVNTERIYKAYTTKIYEGKDSNRKIIDDLLDLQMFCFDTPNKEPLCWGWYGVSSFAKQIPEEHNLARGIRLRKDNIQIGSEYCLVKLHKEQRGNFYFFGEVHALHPNLIPNARRDYFLENETSELLEQKLKDLFHNELYKLYYFASKVRSNIRRINQLVEYKKEYDEKSTTGFTNKEEAKNYDEKFDTLKEKAVDSQEKLTKIEAAISGVDSPERKIFDKLTQRNDVNDIKVDAIEPSISQQDQKKPKYLTDDLTTLTYKEKKFLSRVFVVINDVLPKDVAENLILKIKEEFK